MPIPVGNTKNDFAALQAKLDADAAEIEKWWSDSRWSMTKRNSNQFRYRIKRVKYL